jgi:hypothetical protein
MGADAEPRRPGVDEAPPFLDRIDALRVLRADGDEERGRLLEEIGGRGKVEQDIVRQLSEVRPLWRPDQFAQAHRMAMRSLEVLDRNGSRRARLPPLGPLEPVAGYAVQQVTRWIVKGHQNSLISNIRKLYERREANSEWGSPERVLLRRARIDAARVEQGLRSKQLGLPTFLVGGAFLSGLVSGISRLVRSAFDSDAGVIITSIVAGVVFAALAWVALFSAGVARRRIRLTSQPIAVLYETVGAAGTPPRDESYNFAVYAIVLLVLSWIVIPVVIWRLLL